MIRHTHHRLANDERAISAVEFGILAPVLVLLLMGLGDLTYRAYAQVILDGAMQKAGRDATIQGAADNVGALDDAVKAAVRNIAKDATFQTSRLSYTSFGNIAPEPFTDSNSNNVRDPGECYTDINNSNSWSAEPGVSGQGGASDVTLYKMTVTYPRLFPMASLLGWSTTQQITSQTLLKNQPYSSQSISAPATRCT